MADKDFETLVNAHSRQVLNVALRILGNEASAQDVHQEVFLAIWKRWDCFNGHTNWNAYLNRTTVRKALQLAKRAGPTAPPTEDAGSDCHPEGPLQATELQQRLTTCLARLPRRQADVFTLSRIEGLSHQEIADALGCSRKTVRVHLHLAVKQLTLWLKDYLVEK